MSFGYAGGKSNNTDLEHVVTAVFYCRIKHGSFHSSCIGENQGTILELNLFS